MLRTSTASSATSGLDPFPTLIFPRIHDVRLIGSVSLVGILALAIVGMEWVTRVQKILLVLLIFSQLDFIIGTFLPPSPQEHAKGFVGWNAKVASTNLWSDYRPDGEGNTPTFFKVWHHILCPPV